MRAARALAEQGWTTTDKLAASSWRERTDTLNRAGFARYDARYDESPPRTLGDTAALLLDQYGGDLRCLRERAERRPARERKLLKECKGIGDVGASIFLREAKPPGTSATRSPTSSPCARPAAWASATPRRHWPSTSRKPSSRAWSPRWCAALGPGITQ